MTAHFVHAKFVFGACAVIFKFDVRYTDPTRPDQVHFSVMSSVCSLLKDLLVANFRLQSLCTLGRALL